MAPDDARSHPSRRHRWAMVAALALLLTACTDVGSNTPATYDAQTEQNFLRGCLASFGVDTSSLAGLAPGQGGTGDTTGDTGGDTGGDTVEIEIPPDAPPEAVDYCTCVYGGFTEPVLDDQGEPVLDQNGDVVTAVPFDTFLEVEDALGELPSDAPADDGGATTTTTIVPRAVQDVIDGCQSPS